MDGVITRYLYDNEDIIIEYDGNGYIKTGYTHGPGTDEPFAMYRSNKLYYYHADALGSIIAMTNQSGSIVQSAVYDTYGNIKSLSNPNLIQPYAYTGREYDVESGFYYYRNRYYNPETGRFITKDPIGFAGGDVNLYRYVKNNPVNFVDPYGLWRGILPGWGPRAHHERNKYQDCPDREPGKGGGDGCGDGEDWYYEGRSPTHGGYKSYRGTGPNRGFQCVYDNEGDLVRDPEYWGTYDYFPPYNDDGYNTPQN